MTNGPVRAPQGIQAEPAVDQTTGRLRTEEDAHRERSDAKKPKKEGNTDG